MRTVHKSQGLTLQRATYTPGNDETHCGITFVALTRVRHPSHIAFAPPPETNTTRLTEDIATKPALIKRQLHEHVLRGFALQTANRFQHLDPPPSALIPRAAPKKKLATAAPQNSKQSRLPRASTTPSHGQHPHATTTGLGSGTVSNPRQQRRRSSPLQDVVSADELHAIRSAGLQLRARIVDFHSTGRTARSHLRACMEELGFDVAEASEATSTYHQFGNECGYVAARALVTMHIAGSGWREVDLSDAIHHTPTSPSTNSPRQSNWASLGEP